MIKTTIVTSTGDKVVKYFSVLPRVGEYIHILFTNCQVKAVIHTPSDSKRTNSTIEILV